MKLIKLMAICTLLFGWAVANAATTAGYKPPVGQCWLLQQSDIKYDNYTQKKAMLKKAAKQCYDNNGSFGTKKPTVNTVQGRGCTISNNTFAHNLDDLAGKCSGDASAKRNCNGAIEAILQSDPYQMESATENTIQAYPRLVSGCK